jgi:DNA-damage-inducible protein J
MSTTTMIHIRLAEQVKRKASAALEAMGLSVSDAVRALLVRVAAEQALPFALRVPNATTRSAMAEADEMARAGRARFATGADLIESLEAADGS